MDDLDAESTELLAAARADTETLGVDVETHTILARDAYPAIFDAAETQNTPWHGVATATVCLRRPSDPFSQFFWPIPSDCA